MELIPLAKKQTQDGEEQEELSSGDSLKLDLYFWLQALVLALVALILLFTFVGRITPVVGESMLPTLHEGDVMLIRDIGYTDPQPGDIVVLTKEFDAARGPIVKRIIAVEGQTVDIDYQTGAVYVDGKTWTARSADGSVLPAGSRVEIRRMEGVKLIVEAAQKAPDKKEEVV